MPAGVSDSASPNAGRGPGTSPRHACRPSENVGTGFLTVPAVHGGANPIRIHFR